MKFGMELGGTNKRGKEEQKGGQKLSDMIKLQLPDSKRSQTKILYYMTLMKLINRNISKQLLSKKKIRKIKMDFRE